MAATGLGHAGAIAPVPAVEALGQDFVFPHALPDLPARLSDFAGLRIGRFTTNDGVELAYWETGHDRGGPPIVFVPS